MNAPSMRVVVLGLSLSSSWGNGHATTYRALLGAFAARGHDVLFLERDAAWYAEHRDLARPDFCRLELYRDLASLEGWRAPIAAADAVLLGSYVPDGVSVGELIQRVARGATAFYDIDTPVTLAALDRGEETYLSAALLPGFDLYLSFTGGPMLERLTRDYGARKAAALYCSVDPQTYRPTDVAPRWDLSYLGTYSPDRQAKLEELLLEPARCAPELRFCVAGPLYPSDLRWPANVERIEHVAPADHRAFYGASRFTLNVTRSDMVRAGWSPSVRLFEAAACGTPTISDRWQGLDAFFATGREILVADRSDDVLDALLGWPEPRRMAIATAARTRVLGSHTAAHRAAELELLLRDAARRRSEPAVARMAS